MALGLWIMYDFVVDPPTGICTSALMEPARAAATKIDADVVLPTPPLVEATVTELFCMPVFQPATFTENVHKPFASKVAPDRYTVVVVLLIVPPPQEPVKPLGVVTTRPEGKLSVNATPSSAVPLFGFVIVNVSGVMPANGITGAPNCLVMCGGNVWLNASSVDNEVTAKSIRNIEARIASNSLKFFIVPL